MPKNYLRCMNTTGTLAEVLAIWQRDLAEMYPEREIAAMFRIALEDILGLNKAHQMQVWNEPVSEDRFAKLEDALRQLSSGKPLQQITGFTYFDDLKISVTSDVLIPRPETEELVYEIVRVLPAGFSGKITDWCTGSGCIALALKKHFPAAAVCGFDISEAALKVAEQNAESNHLSVDFSLKNALETVESSRVDLIVSNPPYIPDNERNGMHRNVVEFEPSIALFVPDNDPLLFYRAIMEKAVNDLVSGGWLFFELHEQYALQTKELLMVSDAFLSVQIIRDLQGKDRMLKARRK